MRPGIRPELFKAKTLSPHLTGLPKLVPSSSSSQIGARPSPGNKVRLELRRQQVGIHAVEIKILRSWHFLRNPHQLRMGK